MNFLKKFTGNQDKDKEEQKIQDEEEAAQKYVLAQLKTLQQTAPWPEIAELAHDFAVTLEQKSVKATLLWQRQKTELTRAVNEEAARLGKIEAWRQFCKNGLITSDGMLQLSTDNENVSLTADPDTPEVIKGAMRDGRTATTKLQWKPWRWLILIEAECAANPDSRRVVLDECLSFQSARRYPEKDILLRISVPLTFLFKDRGR
jgi:hypothetical protein